MKSVVITVCEEFGVDSADFFGRCRERELVDARREAIARLINAGFSMAATARMIRKSYSTVQYWLKPHLREHRAIYGAANNHRWPRIREKKTNRVTSSPEQRTAIVSVYRTEGLEAAVLLAASMGITRQSTFRYLRKAGIIQRDVNRAWMNVANQHQPVIAP